MLGGRPRRTRLFSFEGQPYESVLDLENSIDRSIQGSTRPQAAWSDTTFQGQKDSQSSYQPFIEWNAGLSPLDQYTQPSNKSRAPKRPRRDKPNNEQVPQVVWSISTNKKPSPILSKAELNKPKRKSPKLDFLARVPNTEQEWSKLRDTSKLNAPKILSVTLQALVINDSTQNIQNFREPCVEQMALRTPLELLKAYQDSKPTTMTNLQSHFRELVFCCIAIISIEEDPRSTEETIRLIKAYSPERRSKNSYVLRRLNSVKRIAYMAESLEDAVGYRGSQLLLMSGLSIENYRKITESKGGAEGFTSQIAKKLNFVSNESEDYNLSFSPIFLIAQMDIDLNIVNEVFGTNLSPEEFGRRCQNSQARFHVFDQEKIRDGTESGRAVEPPKQGFSEQMTNRISAQPINHDKRKLMETPRPSIRTSQAYYGKDDIQQDTSRRAKQPFPSRIWAAETVPESVLGQAASSPQRCYELSAEYRIKPQDSADIQYTAIDPPSVFVLQTRLDAAATSLVSGPHSHHDLPDYQRTKNQGSPWFSSQVFIRVPVIIQYDHPILVCVQEGDIDGVRGIWEKRAGHIDMVDPYGLGLLYYSTYYCWRNCGYKASVKMSEALIGAGANVFWLDDSDSLPMHTMLDIVRIESTTNNRPFDSCVAEIQRLFGETAVDLLGTYRDARGFTPIHEAMFCEDREAQLTQALWLGHMIDAQDKSGRTALAWAVEYGFHQAVETLLDFGAYPDQRRRSWSTDTSLVHIALAGPSLGQWDAAYLDIAGMLLRHGADINSRDHEGWTPLHIAASWKSHTAISVLMEQDRGRLDWGALTFASQSAIDLTLEAGGDLLLQDLLIEKVRCSLGHMFSL